MTDEVRIQIKVDSDLVPARAEGRAMAVRLGFSRPDPTLIATAISEIGRNIVMHGGSGEMVMRALYEADRHGMVVIAQDAGAGIRNVKAAPRTQTAERP